MNQERNIDFNWDFNEPNEGHKERFLLKLNHQEAKKKKKNWLSFAIAACFILGFGMVIILNFNFNSEVKFSPQMQETHDYFSSIIISELNNLKKQENPQTSILINDALKEMKKLEIDYEILKKEIAQNGENKQIIFAMITNMQTRISFIKSVLEQVEHLKNNPHENNL